MRRGVAAVLALGLLAGIASCRAGDSAAPRTRGTQSGTPSTAAEPAPAPPTTAPCSSDPSLAAPAAPVPPDLALAVQRFATDPRVTANRFGLSIWIDGLGEVGAHEPDLPLFPASNQKLLTAMGVLTVLGPDVRFTTEVRLAPDGSLVIVAGGDPSLAARGQHSLDALAAQVRAAGVTEAPGMLVIDDSRHDAVRRAAGWQDWQFPTYAGPLSAFMVDRNRYRRDAAFLADPGLAHGDLLRAALAAHGVRIAGPTAHGSAPAGSTVVASLTSAPVSALLADTLLRSDNMAAEELLEGGRALDRRAGLHPRRAADDTSRARTLVRPDRRHRRRRLRPQPRERAVGTRVATAAASRTYATVVAAAA